MPPTKRAGGTRRLRGAARKRPSVKAVKYTAVKVAALPALAPSVTRYVAAQPALLASTPTPSTSSATKASRRGFEVAVRSGGAGGRRSSTLSASGAASAQATASTTKGARGSSRTARLTTSGPRTLPMPNMALRRLSMAPLRSPKAREKSPLRPMVSPPYPSPTTTAPTSASPRVGPRPSVSPPRAMRATLRTARQRASAVRSSGTEPSTPTSAPSAWALRMSPVRARFSP